MPTRLRRRLPTAAFARLGAHPSCVAAAARPSVVTKVRRCISGGNYHKHRELATTLQRQTQNYLFWGVVAGGPVAGVCPRPTTRNHYTEQVVLTCSSNRNLSACRYIMAHGTPARNRRQAAAGIWSMRPDL